MVGLKGLYKSQGLHAPGPSGRVISSLACTSNRSASGCGTVFLILRQQGPDDARILVGDGHDGAARPAALPELIHPLAEPIRLADCSSNDRAGAMDQQSSQMLIATFADPHQDCSISAGMLARDQSQPGSHVSTVVEVAAIPDRGNDGSGGLRPYATYLPHPATGLTLPVDLVDASVELPDPLVDLGHQCQEGRQGLAAKLRELIALVFDDPRDHGASPRDRLPEGDPTIEQNATHLTDQCGSVIDHALPRPMQGLHILLGDTLLRHEPHAGLDDCNRDGLGIVAVILLPPTKRLDVLRRDDPDLMAKRLELALPIKCAGASLDTNHTGRDLCDSPKKCLPPHTSA